MRDWSDKYQKIEQIGSGSSGKIYKVRSKETDQIMAAKVIKVQSQKSEFESIEQQVKIMTTCNHINIIKCLGVELFDTEVWIMLEYCEGHSLADIMKARKTLYNEQEISTTMKQVIEGLSYLHKRGIVHRDIKASNLLYHKGVIKIADFGISLLNSEGIGESKLGRFGSPYWMSPQVLSQSIYNDKTDIWALGITAIELAEGQPPFSHQHPFRAIYSIQTHPPQGLSKPEKWSKSFVSFVKNCLNIDYKSRPTAKSLVSHQFLSSKDQQSYIQNSPTLSNQSENTIIMHDDIPKSIWQKQSYPQSTQKDKELNYSVADTVIIKEYPNEQQQSLRILTSQKKQFLIDDTSPIKQKPKDVNFFQKTQLRQKQVKELLNQMQIQVKQVRRRYMTKIRALYKENSSQLNKQNEMWSSPLKKLKQKNSQRASKDHYKNHSDLASIFY